MPPTARSRRSSPAAPRAGSSAALRALGVLEAVAAAPEPAGLDEVARATSLPKPTALRLLQTLEAAGLLQREPGPKSYAAGPRLLRLAWSTLAHARFRAERRAILQRLVESVGETCNVAMLDGRELVYLDRVETSSPLRLNLAPGSRLPLHCTSGGKLFLAALPRSRWERLLGDGPLARHTPRTITRLAALAEELGEIRRQGWSADREEFIAGIVCLAVPVRGPDGALIASLALQAPLARVTHEQSLAHLPALRAAAAELAGTFAPDGGPREKPPARNALERSRRPGDQTAKRRKP